MAAQKAFEQETGAGTSSQTSQCPAIGVSTSPLAISPAILVPGKGSPIASKRAKITTKVHTKRYSDMRQRLALGYQNASHRDVWRFLS